MRTLASSVASVLLFGLLAAPAGLAQEKIKLMYLETEEEVRAAVLIGRLRLPLVVHRVGIFRVGKQLYGVVRFGEANGPEALPDHHRLASTAVALSDRLFGEMPSLVQIDFEGVSQRETKELKPEVLFSASVGRQTWKTIPKTLTPLARLQQAGTLYFDARLPVGSPPPPARKPRPPATREKSVQRESSPL